MIHIINILKREISILKISAFESNLDFDFIASLKKLKILRVKRLFVLETIQNSKGH
jgi:hypothetical protein